MDNVLTAAVNFFFVRIILIIDVHVFSFHPHSLLMIWYIFSPLKSRRIMRYHGICEVFIGARLFALVLVGDRVQLLFQISSQLEIFFHSWLALRHNTCGINIHVLRCNASRSVDRRLLSFIIYEENCTIIFCESILCVISDIWSI